MATGDNLIGLIPLEGKSIQLPSVHVDEEVIAGYGEDIEGFESERRGTVMSRVFRKQLWKRTVSKLIQVRDIMQHCCCCCGHVM